MNVLSILTSGVSFLTTDNQFINYYFALDVNCLLKVLLGKLRTFYIPPPPNSWLRHLLSDTVINWLLNLAVLDVGYCSEHLLDSIVSVLLTLSEIYWFAPNYRVTVAC